MTAIVSLSSAMLQVRSLLRAGILLLAMACLTGAPKAAQAHDGQSEADLVQRLLPAVVNIFIRKPPDLPASSMTASASSSANQDALAGEWKRFYGSGLRDRSVRHHRDQSARHRRRA